MKRLILALAILALGASSFAYAQGQQQCFTTNDNNCIKVGTGIASSVSNRPLPVQIISSSTITVSGNIVVTPSALQDVNITQLLGAAPSIVNPFPITGTISLDAWGGTLLGTPSNFGTSPGAVVAGSVNASMMLGTTAMATDPCLTNTHTISPFSITTATTTNIISGSSLNKNYICYMYLQTGAANNVAIIEGTGATCGGSTAAMVGGTTAANGLNNAANSGQVFSNAGRATMQTAGNTVNVCLITSSVGPLAGVVRTVQAP